MRDRPLITFHAGTVLSDNMPVGKYLERPGDKWRKKVDDRRDQALRVIFLARYNLPVIGADSYDDVRVKVTDALKGRADR